jgi:hypothetical protein
MAQVPGVVYDLLQLIRRTNVSGLVSRLEELLPVTGINFGSLVPEDTGVDVNVSQVFSGTILTRIREELNITAADNQVVDVGRLFADATDGTPIVTTSDLLEFLPQVRERCECLSIRVVQSLIGSLMAGEARACE